MKKQDGRREGSREMVAAEKQGLKVVKRGQVGDGTGEGVVMETENTELVETGEGVGGKSAKEAEIGEEKADDAALNAIDASPLTVVETLVENVKKLVMEVGFGFEGEDGNGVGWQH